MRDSTRGSSQSTSPTATHAMRRSGPTTNVVGNTLTFHAARSAPSWSRTTGNVRPSRSTNGAMRAAFSWRLTAITSTPSRREAVAQALQRRHLGDAGHAPRRPEIDDHRCGRGSRERDASPSRFFTFSAGVGPPVHGCSASRMRERRGADRHNAQGARIKCRTIRSSAAHFRTRRHRYVRLGFTHEHDPCPMYRDCRAPAPPTPQAERRALVAGLRATPAAIPPKYFYDALGCALFGAICELPEYYPTRTERAIFASTATRSRAAVGRGRPVRRPGRRRLLQGARVAAVPRARALRRRRLRRRRDRAVRSRGWRRSSRTSRCSASSPTSRAASTSRRDLDAGPVTFFYPGSSIGNFSPARGARVPARHSSATASAATAAAC